MMWWQEAISAAAAGGDQPQAASMQHQQHLLHQQIAQQQSAAAAAAVAQQQQQQQSAQQQQQQQQQIQSTSPSPQQQVFSYKMASSFQNPATTVSNVSSTSPLGAAGIRGYDYRLGGGGMAAGNPATMSAPAPAAQWWYSSAMDNTLQSSLQNNMQSNLGQNNIPTSIQSLQSVQTPTSVRLYSIPMFAFQSQAQLAELQQQQHHLQQQHLNHHQQQLQNHLGHPNHLPPQQQQQQQQPPPAAPVATNKRMPRGKGGDARPRGRMTAYAFFVQTCREEHKKKHPDENVVFAEFSKKCAERWKTMLDKEKKRFQEMAEKDKKRYDAEMLNYTPPKGEKQRGKKRKQVKDPNAPKRSLSAFFWFCNDERSKVKSINPEYGVGDIAKELGRRWSDADPESKSKYEAMAEQDKARYEKEMTAYKKRNNPALQPVAVVPEPEEEEDEEEGDDDDDD